MSAAELRQAAETLRDRAEVATPGPWTTGPFMESDRVYVLPANDLGMYVCAGGHVDVDDDAAYIATMHPGVGLALAQWLYNIAHNWDAQSGGLQADATDVARLINGGAA